MNRNLNELYNTNIWVYEEPAKHKINVHKLIVNIRKEIIKIFEEFEAFENTYITFQNVINPQDEPLPASIYNIVRLKIVKVYKIKNEIELIEEEIKKYI